MSGVLCLALVLGLLPAAGLTQIAEAAHWADPDGEKLVEWGVMMPSEDLRLSDTITRAEFVTMLNRAFGYSRLGGTPFTDVPYTEWYAEDIDIAYNAGYFMGGGDNKALPLDTLSREQAAVLLSRCMRLQETVGDNLDFIDGHDLSDWSRGLIGAAAAEGVVNGLPDGSFSPSNDITRGEVATMLVRAIGNPIGTPGVHELGDVYGNVTISSSDVTLRDTVILGNLHITGGIDLGNVLLENVTVLGRIIVSGGGESHEAKSSVVLRNVKADELDVDSMVNQFVTISSYGLTDIPFTSVRSDTYLEDSCAPGYGLHYIEQDGANLLQLAGSIKEVKNKTPRSRLQLVEGTAEKITIDETAVGCEMLVDINTVVEELNLDVASHVYGQGDIIDLNIWASGCEVEIIPEHVTIRPGLTAIVGDEVVGSVEAAEMSANPRLLAGYPFAASLRPDRAEGMYAGNKPGTIYWAVSPSAKGSVSEANLLNPPAYGGNIHQSGSIDVTRASAEYAREITGLEPDGSYYISAILVDDRGKRSPVKVISFSTPDDTVPAFVEAPHMTLVSCETAQVTTMANKSCQLYWVLLPAGAPAPTPANFESGSFGASYGSGSMSVVKNGNVSIKVNSYLLPEKTSFDLYLWLDDFDGAMSSAVTKVVNESGNASDPSFTTPDETAPVITGPTQTGYGEADAQVSFGVSETPVTLYWVVTREDAPLIAPGTEDTLQSQIMVKSATANIVVRGSKEVTGDVRETYFIEPADFKAALTGAHSFIFYCVAEDAEGNFSEVKVITIRTLDTDPPHVWLEFSNALNGNPRIDSDIRLVFDEEVQGGADAEYTFLELYELVEAYEKLGEGSKKDLDSARNALAEELAAHFKLRYIPKSGAAQDQSVKTDVDSKAKDWVIDWTQAIVTKENGNLVIRIPNSGLNLDSGAGYEFRLFDVCDCAINRHNAMAVGTDGVTCVKEGGKASESNSSTIVGALPRISFRTVYAQIAMRDQTGVVTSIHYKDHKDADMKKDKDGNLYDEKGHPYEGYRLDIVVDLIPEDTSKVPPTEVWDLIMWSDNIMRVDVFRIILKDDNGKDGEVVKDWEKVTNKTADNVRFNTAKEGRGLSANKADPAQITASSYDKVYDTAVEKSLQKGYIYRYGIHITHLGGEEGKEGDPTKTPPDWDQTVVMRFSVIAGLQRDVGAVSSNVNGNYEKPDNGITEIGVWESGTSMESKIECKWPFVDTRAPSFRNTYPSFTTGSNSFNMTVSLNRSGTIHYAVVAAEPSILKGLDSISVEINSSTPINKTNDGQGFEELSESAKKDKINALANNTYIPLNGSERETYKNKIYFMNNQSGVSLDKTLDKYVAGLYGNPDYLYIKNQKCKTLAGAQTDTYEVSEGGTIETISISSLKSDTWYYVYIVLEGTGATDYAVQIYRVKTDEAQTPTIRINSTYTTATLTPDSYVQMDYVLVSSTALPDFFNDDSGQYKVECGDVGDKTALWAMLNRPGGDKNGQKTYFDLYAKDPVRSEVMNYLLSPNRSTAPGVIYAQTVVYDPAKESGGVFEDFGKEGKDAVLPEYIEGQENVNTYVLLAVAANYSLLYPTDIAEAADYGFAAADGLARQSLKAPELTGVYEYKDEAGGTSLNLRVFLTKVTYTDPKDKTKSDVTAKWGNYSDDEIYEDMTFTGSVYISFTVPIYQIIRGSTRTLPILTHEYNETTCEDHAGEANGGVEFMSLVSHSTKVKLDSTYEKYEGAQSMFKLDFEDISYSETIIFLMQGNIIGSNPSGYIYPYRVTLFFDPFITNKELGIGYVNKYASGFRVTLTDSSQ